MPSQTPLRPPRGGRRVAFAGALSAFAVAASAVNASASIAVSSNWSGYAVTGTTFSTVSGSWAQPNARCSASAVDTTASAFWVGLGGEAGSSNALEQTGTEADCLPNGTIRYSAWYELVPRASVRISLKVSAGDLISASVSVSGTSVTLRLSNLTTHMAFAKTLKLSAPDISSAEWIAEAPSAVTPGGTNVLPLTDFGTVRFSKATARSTGGHRGTISDPNWSASRIELESTGSAGGPRPFSPFAAYDVGATRAIPTVLASGGDAFSVTYREDTSAAAQTSTA